MWMWTGPGLPSKAMLTASSSTSHVSAMSVRRNDFLVVASNIFWESGVRLRPEVSLSDPFPLHSSDAYPETARTGYESDIATASPENRLNAPGPAVAKQKPSLSVYIAYPQAMNDAACSWRVMTGRIVSEALSASIKPAAFSPAPPKAASTPTPSSPL